MKIPFTAKRKAMNTFVMLTRIAPGAIASPGNLEELEREVMNRIRSECPKVKWINSWALLGPYDYIDVFEAPDIASAMKVATLVRTYGKAQAEVSIATEWKRFKEVVHELRPVSSM
jgi:uncharacterized protein with GYD domain